MLERKRLGIARKATLTATYMEMTATGYRGREFDSALRRKRVRLSPDGCFPSRGG
jgi:hypothetical protein